MKRYILLLCVFLNLFQIVNAQQIEITYSSKGFSLNNVLEDLSSDYNLKFAFDADSFQQIKTSFDIKQSSINEFLQLIETKYFIKSKLIDGTWVLILTEPELTKQQPEINEVPQQPKLIRISGYVKDAQTNEDLLYCNVISGDYRGTMTNDLGFFSFEVTETDSIQILISHLGYKKLDTLISTQKTATILLQPSEFMMEEVLVTFYEKQVLEDSPQPDIIAFNPIKSTNLPRISNDDLANALLIIPGVNFFQGSSAGISIRGSDPTDNLVLFDGIPVLETSHLLGNMSVLNSNYVQQAFISRGGFDAEFGGRSAGMIEVIGKSGKNNRPYVDVSANLLNLNLLASVPITDKFSVTAAWRRSYIDQWQNYLYMRLIEGVSSDEGEDNMVQSTIYPTINYQDVNAKFSFHPSDNIEFNLNILYGDDFQSRDFELINTKEYYRNEMVKSKNKGLSFNWNWQMNDKWFHSFTAGYSNLDKDIVDETGQLETVSEFIENPGKGDEKGKGKGKGLSKTREKIYSKTIYDIDNGNNNIEEFRSLLKTEYKTGIFRNQAGIGWSSNFFEYDYYANRTQAEYPIDSIVNSVTQNLFNAFVQQHIQLNNQLNLRWGIRTNVDVNAGNTYWEPRGGVEFHPTKEISINFSSGIYHQFLSSIKRIDSEGHYNHVWYLPNNEEVGIVKASHNILGLKIKDNGWFVNAEGYIKNSSGRMILFADLLEIDGNKTVAYAPRAGKERNRGVDLFIQKKQGIYNHMLGYSLSRTDEQIDGIADGTWIPGNNDRLHMVKFTEMVSYKNWTLTGSWHIASGLPIYNLTDDNSILSETRTDFFSQIDFALAKKIQVSSFSINGGLSLLNVTNRKNIVEVDYLRFTSETESLTVRSDISALAFTPVFFVNIKYQ
jgi:ferric enterobactin receptor